MDIASKNYDHTWDDYTNAFLGEGYSFQVGEWGRRACLGLDHRLKFLQRGSKHSYGGDERPFHVRITPTGKLIVSVPHRQWFREISEQAESATGYERLTTSDPILRENSEIFRNLFDRHGYDGFSISDHPKAHDEALLVLEESIPWYAEALNQLGHVDRAVVQRVEMAKEKRGKDILSVLYNGDAERIYEAIGARDVLLPPDAIEVKYDLLVFMVEDGCGQACRVCDLPAGERKVRPRSLDDVISQIKFYRVHLGEEADNYHCVFLGGENALACDTEFLRVALRGIEKEFHFHTKMSVDSNPDIWCLSATLHPRIKGFAYLFGTFEALTRKTVDDLIDLRNSGVRRINFGYESGNPLIVDSLFGRKVDISMVDEGIRKLIEAEMHFSINVVAGVRDEETNREHLQMTAEALKGIGFKGDIYIPIYQPSGLRGSIEQTDGWKKTPHQTTVRSMYEFRTMMGDGEDTTSWFDPLRAPVRVIPYPVIFY